MNVALFPSAFHPHVGGVEEHVRQLAHCLRGAGHSAIVLTNRWPRSLPAHETVETIPVYRLALRVPDGGAKPRLSYLLTHRAIVSALTAILRRHKPDVIHVHCVSSNGYYAGIAARRLGIPLVVTTHGELTGDATGLFERSPFARSVLRGSLDDAAVITACSGRSLDEVVNFYGTPFGDRARVVYNGVRISEFAGRSPHVRSRPYIFAMGRLVRQKGFDVLIRAFADLVGAGESRYDLVIAGDGPERANLGRLSVDLGVDRFTAFAGQLDRASAAQYFVGCAFFTLPSRGHEGLGIVNLEAMASGRAVIASNIGGVPEVVQDGRTGLLVPDEDPTALAAAMKRLIGDAHLRAAMGEAGRARAAEFDWDAITEQYVECYRDAMAASGSARRAAVAP